MPHANDEALSSDSASTGEHSPTAQDQATASDSAETGAQVYANPEHPKRIAEWISRHWKHGPCPVCESNRWATGGMFEVPAFAPVAGMARAMVPAFPIGCSVCGYILWINAVTAEVVRPGEERLFTVQQWEGQQWEGGT